MRKAPAFLSRLSFRLMMGFLASSRSAGARTERIAAGFMSLVTAACATAEGLAPARIPLRAHDGDCPYTAAMRLYLLV
jgi:hypothetical protein